MTKPYHFAYAIMPLAHSAASAEHLITITAKLKAWPTKLQRSGGPLQVAGIKQADGAH